MARVRPFPAVRYTREEADLTPVAAPPYDVVSPGQRERLLAAEPTNVVALELADGPLDPSVPGNRYETAGKLWREWLADGTLAEDARPAVYVLEQRFERDGATVSRRAFVAEVGLEDFAAGIVLPHERTLPKALGDRFHVLTSTAANLSPVFGLYNDPERATDRFITEAMAGPPLLHATDDDGVVSRVWAITDPEAHDALEEFFAPQRVFIADGHHRYTVALAYRDERRAREAAAGRKVLPDARYESVMMALANMDDPGLIVLPTHRVADAEGTVDPAAFTASLRERFDVREAGAGHEAAAALTAADRPSFLVKTAEGLLLATLRTDVDPAAVIGTAHSDAWKRLDVALLQELILLPLLGIHPDRTETLERLSFVKDAHQALEMVPPHDVAFVLNPTRMDQMREVALAGDTMPQKSTYFYPKLLSGLLMRSAG